MFLFSFVCTDEFSTVNVNTKKTDCEVLGIGRAQLQKMRRMTQTNILKTGSEEEDLGDWQVISDESSEEQFVQI